MVHLPHTVRTSAVARRWTWGAFGVLAGVAGAAMISAAVLERANAPFTLNLLTAADYLISAVMFAVLLLGLVVVAARPGHRSAVLMVAAGTAFATYLLSHAVAVRLLVVTNGPHRLGEFAEWLSAWLLIPSFGLLPFVIATWPTGAIGTRWLHQLGRAAAAGLVVATVAQALAPGEIDGVAPTASITNPLGIGSLALPVTVATSIAVGVLFVFTLAAIVELVVRIVRTRGKLRRQLLPTAFAVMLVPFLALAALPLGVFGVAAAYVVAIVGTGAGLVLATHGMRRSERADAARAALVAQREDERLRLRRELHDGLGPLLAALRLELDRTAGSPGRSRALVDDAIAEVRRISRDLRPAALDELGLVGALRQQTTSLRGASGPDIELATPATSPELPAAVEVNLLRISGEALTNAVRHSHASRCRVELHVDGVVRLRVSDNGVGCATRVEGVGITSMRARAEELGGQFEVRACVGGGTIVEAVLPLPEPAS